MRQLLLLFVFSIGSGGEAQTTRPIDVPWVGVIYLLDPVTQALKPLPDEMWHIRLGLGRIATVSQDVSGERSSFRITTHTPQFVFQFGSPENANLYISNNKTKRRFLPNLQYRRFWVEAENRWVRLRITNAALRLIDKVGIEKVLVDLRARGEI